MDFDQDSRRHRGCLTLMLIIVGIFGCAVTLTFVLDNKCASDIGAWMPTYPNAEQISLKYEFFRPYAMGKTTGVYHSDDDTRTVRNWYIAVQTALDDAGESRGLATTAFSIQEDRANGGTNIVLNSECASR